MEVVSVPEAAPSILQPGSEIVEDVNGISSLRTKVAVVPMRKPKKTRPTSCRLQLIMSPCVKKVSLHLELLSTAIESIIEQKNTKPKDENTRSHVRLQVVGIGQQPTYEEKLESEAKVIVNEVLGVVEKLENDITDTENRLQNQRETAGSFKSGLHQLRRQQLASLHAAVDYEHSSCFVDIQELEWHVNYNRRQVNGIEKRYRIALKVNYDFRKEIDFFRNSLPQLSEKTVDESSVMDKIEEQQSTAKVELEHRDVVLKNTEKKHETAVNKINEERNFINNDLKKVRQELDDVKQGITNARAEYDYMVEKKKRSEDMIKKNEIDKQLFELKSDNLRAQTKTQTEINKNISADLDVILEEGRDKEKQLMTVTAEFDTQKSTWDDILTQLQHDYDGLHEKHRVLHQETNDLEAIVDDKQRQLDAMKKRKTELETTVKRMEKDTVKYEDQMLLIVGEIAKLEHLVYAAEAELKKLLAQNAEAERAKRSITDNLKQQINQLKHEIQMLTSRYESDLQDFETIRQQTEWKKEQFGKLITEQNASINDKSKKVSRLEQKNNERLANVANLEAQLSDLRADRAATEVRLNEETEAARARIVELKQRKKEQEDELKAMRTDSERLHNSLKEMSQIAAALASSSKRHDARLEELKKIFDESEKQMLWRKTIEEEIKTRLSINETCMTDGAEKQAENIRQRREVLRLVTECLGSNFYYNAYLTSKYRLRQHELDDARSRLSEWRLKTSLQQSQGSDSTLTAKFLAMFEKSQEMSWQVRRAYCSVHQQNLDCDCCRNVRDIRDICHTMGNDAEKDGQELVEMKRQQLQIRDNAKLIDFKDVVPFHVAAKLVSKPPIALHIQTPN